jgi:hypothetical protein
MQIPTFDKSVWIARLRDEWRKKYGKGFGRRNAYRIQLSAIDSLERTVYWLAIKGYCVEFRFGAEAMLHPDDQSGRVQINKTNPPETQLHMLLHECGHLLLMRTRGYRKRFGQGYPLLEMQITSKLDRRDPVHRTMVVTEECAAWDAGLKLAKKLSLDINRERFDTTRAKKLQSYFAWAVDKKWDDDDV